LQSRVVPALLTSGNCGFEPVGITLLMVAKKLHMPAVDGLRVRARGAAASVSEKAGPLLHQSVERLRKVRDAVAETSGKPPKEAKSFWDREGSGAHAAFLEWCEDNRDDGFVINCKTASEMWLHRARCPAFEFGPDAKVSLTRNRKVCSLDREQLVRWVGRQWGVTLIDCSRCAP